MTSGVTKVPAPACYHLTVPLHLVLVPDVSLNHVETHAAVAAVRDGTLVRVARGAEVLEQVPNQHILAAEHAIASRAFVVVGVGVPKSITRRLN